MKKCEFRLSDEMFNVLNDIAKQYGVTRSSLIGMWVNDKIIDISNIKFKFDKSECEDN